MSVKHFLNFFKSRKRKPARQNRKMLSVGAVFFKQVIRLCIKYLFVLFVYWIQTFYPESLFVLYKGRSTRYD